MSIRLLTTKTLGRLVRSNYLAVNLSLTRCIFSKTNVWPEKVTFDSLKEIETHWRPVLEDAHKKYCDNDQLKTTRKKKYILSMFPYPSGRLHLGHVRVYTLSDVLARYYRMRNNYVIHPIGWDAFGLPAENAAIERNIKPDVWTKSNVEYMRNQLKELSYSFDWNREFATCDESYYKWTQHIFLQLYEKGVVFQKEALVNWDPVDKTVLANEQIDDDGKSWRSGALVEKKILKQWFIKSSYYAKSLLDMMSELNTEDWDLVKNIQKRWIGNCDGCFIEFDLKTEDPSLSNKLGKDARISVYTKTPHGIYGASHIVINKKHILLKQLDDLAENSELKVYALNPMNNSRIPIYLKSDDDFGHLNAQSEPYVDAKLGIPSLNEADRDFAANRKINFTLIIDESKPDVLINSNEFSNMNTGEALNAVTKLLRQKSRGGLLTSDRLNDWCISRQRFWGAPIPLVNCDKCKVVPVPYEQLPVRLPEIVESASTSTERKGEVKGLVDLFKQDKWINTTCPKCHGPAKRETDTMDTFVDSSWYYFRYLDVNNKNEPFGKEVTLKEMPVDVYIGGIEHAMTHLFVSRLISHFFYEKSYLRHREPFKRFVSIGMVKGDTFKTKSGRYIPSDQVETKDGKFFSKDTNEPLTKEFEKMSKSKLNGVDPQFMIQKYGVDFTRYFLLSFVHPKSERNFSLSSDMVDGAFNTLQKIWSLVLTAGSKDRKAAGKPDGKELEKWNAELYKTRNVQLAMLDYNLSENFNMPSYLVAISKIVKTLKRVPESCYSKQYYELLIETLVLFSPVIPHFSSECWNYLKTALPSNQLTNFDLNKLVVEQNWPRISDDWKAELSFLVNGKKVNKLKVEMKQKELEELKLTEATMLLKSLSKNKHASKVDNGTSEDDLKKTYKASLQRTPHGAILSIEDN